ncbi:Scytalone dehydratase [Lecanosticta acicola]|uniref:Scytalone dehydratase n=1 Tax=Lecanosticta acicola TaxID=111012 RepID=A0AAI8Z7S4_9PEZI|nr:Scytalone dehydratase [Lecanosticta acicola]
MHLSILTAAAFLALSPPLRASTTTQKKALPPTPPTPPALVYLYTAHVTCRKTLYESPGPRGIRTVIPITGGNFTGPRLAGAILDLGADWGLRDPRTGLLTADTRYNLQTHDGAQLFVQTSGPSIPAGGLHLRVLIETGDARYYWLNNLVMVGVLSRVAEDAEGVVLRIDVWHLAGEYLHTTFVNGTTY